MWPVDHTHLVFLIFPLLEILSLSHSLQKDLHYDYTTKTNKPFANQDGQQWPWKIGKTDQFFFPSLSFSFSFLNTARKCQCVGPAALTGNSADAASMSVTVCFHCSILYLLFQLIIAEHTLFKLTEMRWFSMTLPFLQGTDSKTSKHVLTHTHSLPAQYGQPVNSWMAAHQHVMHVAHWECLLQHSWRPTWLGWAFILYTPCHLPSFLSG